MNDPTPGQVNVSPISRLVDERDKLRDLFDRVVDALSLLVSASHFDDEESFTEFKQRIAEAKQVLALIDDYDAAAPPAPIPNPNAGGREIEALKRRLDIRLNDALLELKPDFDDSITGFNEAWDVMRGLFKEVMAATPHAGGRATPAMVEADEFAWVVERYYGDRLHYWNPRTPSHPWTNDPDWAVRFSRKADAETVLYHLCDGQGRSAEHGWVTKTAAPLLAETAKLKDDNGL